MNILLLGSGGRECTFAWKIVQSRLCDQLFIAPGNAGTSEYGRNVDIAPDDFNAVKDFVNTKGISLVIVGPEDPLVKGIKDYFLSDEALKNVPVIGPDREGAQLEGSKDFSKKFMKRYHIPTASYESFNAESLDDGLKFLESLKPPYVLKADGLAAGKGVLILDDLEEAKTELRSMIMDGKFGAAGNTVVVEEFLNGIELSMFILTDGSNYLLLPEAKDYKRIGEGDTGLNTGGMGAVSPVPFADSDFRAKVEDRIIRPTLKGLSEDGITYKGFLFIGLMNVEGNPYVIEYNVRMGDPETEVVIPRIKNDLVELLIASESGTLDEHIIETDRRTAVTVMLVSGGYPGNYEKGKLITGMDNVKESIPFHAGTKEVDGGTVTSGGRVLALTSFGNSISEALTRSMINAEQINFDRKYYRKDIGADLVN